MLNQNLEAVKILPDRKLPRLNFLPLLYSRTKTIKSKIDSLWNHVRQKRKDFESQPDTGLLPKTASRHIHRIVNYFLKGFIGTLIILLVLPITMVLVSTGSLFLAMASPIFVWIGSALFHFLCFLFFDIEGDSPIIAVGKSQIIRVFIKTEKMNMAKSIVV